MAKAQAAAAETKGAAATKGKAAETKPAAEKPAKEVKAKEINGKPYTARITFGSDKDGKEYNATDNNPKRRKAGERFASYKKNMTVQAALDAGVTPADVKWDLDHGFIKFVE